MRTRFIVATRHDEDAFFRSSLLAQSLEQLANRTGFLLEPAFRSSAGLAAVYNPAIERSQPDDLLVFIHDDVYLDDWYFDVRLRDALTAFDVVGIAGAIVRHPRQPAWWAAETRGQLIPTDSGTQSGAIKHVKVRRRRTWARLIESGLAHLGPGRGAWRQQWIVNPDGSYALKPVEQKGPAAPSVRHGGSGAGKLDFFGPSPVAVKLLDGVFIAARADRLQQSTVRFDPRFKYHFYDLDFCRQCEASGITMGTWPLSLTHASYGSWGDAWRKARNLYLDKWRD